MTDFTFHTLENTSDTARPILEQIQKGYGFIPNLFAYMAEAPTTLEAYLSLNKIIENTSFTPAQQQVALLAASVENDCEFCTVAHRAIGKMKQASIQTLNAINAKENVEDAKDAALANFTQSVVKNRGVLTEETLNDFLGEGFTKQQIFEVMIIVSIKTLSNYINHLTKPEPNPELLSMI
ncbi:hypothetical protein MNBD_GAMMA12-945 [hydrothermal vent metagenome]|uniref:Carboxymuconolactone decarboxylase-like domain-containing protein n=1 Tax=hydrothermal vent metagenome TaxID=652676 RepID=A0A3B0Z466_9ZZZZ